jgi:hypothetical protein
VIAVPFRRIFILQPEILAKGMDVRKEGVAEDLLLYLQNAISAGADAVYARTHTLPDELAIPLLRFLGSLPQMILPSLLIPAVHAKPAPHFTALHYRSTQTYPAGKKLPGLPSGKSCHSLSEVIQAAKDGFDYVFFSPVFSTVSHPDTIPQGVDILDTACKSVSIPVFALGGITPESEKKCLAAGAYGIAATRMFMR